MPAAAALVICTSRIAAALTAHALVGYVPAISEGVPALTRGRISHVDQNSLRPENYTAANSILIIAQDAIALAKLWGGGLVAGIGGMRFVVPVRSIHARPNPKYFGRWRGARWLNMLDDQAVGLAGRVPSGTRRDSLHMIDLIYSQDAGQRPDVIITDTGSYSDIVFALLGRRAAALQDGSVDVLDDSGATIATLAAPWARDAISIPAGSRSRPRSRVTSPTASRRSR